MNNNNQENTTKKEYFFVYGTLKRGYGNNRIFQNSPTAQFVEEGITEPKFNLYDLGFFPGVTEDGTTAIKGEIWSVEDEETKRRLDGLEGYYANDPKGGLYDKKVIVVNEKPVNIYLINNERGKKLESGKWER